MRWRVNASPTPAICPPPCVIGNGRRAERHHDLHGAAQHERCGGPGLHSERTRQRQHARVTAIRAHRGRLAQNCIAFACSHARDIPVVLGFVNN